MLTTDAVAPLTGQSTSVDSGVIQGAQDFYTPLTGESVGAIVGLFAASQEPPLYGNAVHISTSSLAQTGGVEAVKDIDGGYGNYGSDLRASFAAERVKKQREEMMELAQSEDQLLLATIRSTLENPKYGF